MQILPAGGDAMRNRQTLLNRNLAGSQYRPSCPFPLLPAVHSNDPRMLDSCSTASTCKNIRTLMPSKAQTLLCRKRFHSQAPSHSNQDPAAPWGQIIPPPLAELPVPLFCSLLLCPCQVTEWPCSLRLPPFDRLQHGEPFGRIAFRFGSGRDSGHR